MAKTNDEHTLNSSVYKEAIILVKDLVENQAKPANATAKTLRKLWRDIELRYPDLLQQMCSKLNFSQETVYSSYGEVVTEILSDDIINWGRIAVIFTFCAHVCKYCRENNMDTQIDNITIWTARFVAELGWVEQQGGWNGLNRCFGDLGVTDNMSWLCKLW